MSAAEKDVRHTSVLFTGTAELPFLYLYNYVLGRFIPNLHLYIKCTSNLHHIYTALHTKFEENPFGNLQHLFLKVAQLSLHHFR